MNILERLNNFIARLTLDGSDDSDKLMRVKGRGRVREFYGSDNRMVLLLQPQGLSARPSKGSTGLVFNLGGNNDQAFAALVSNQEKRPSGLEEGEVVLWNEFGHTLKIDKDGKATLTVVNCEIIAEEKVILTAPKIYLGGEAGAKAVALKGATDNDGDEITGGCSDIVFAR
jgi:phage gp45-like